MAKGNGAVISLACVGSETHNLQAVFFFVFSTRNDGSGSGRS